MHGFDNGYSAMAGYDLVSLLISLVVLADLILLGVFLWKQIAKK